jgi:hypothetical protein
VVQLSLLSIISRLSPIAERPFENISYDSLDVSRKALDAHGQSLDELCTLTHENEVVNRLFNKFVCSAPSPSQFLRFHPVPFFSPCESLTLIRNSTILAAPFIPYLIVFCGVVGDCSQQDLARLEKFNVCLSLSSYSASPCPSKRPKRFFGLLYEMARLYYESNATDRGHDGIASAEMSDFIDVAALEAAGWQLSPQELLSDGSKAVEVPLEVSRTDADGEDGRKHPQWPLG